MKEIARGAEAILYQDKENLIKHRIKKGYRIEQIDIPLREKRTKKESRLISEARRIGIPVPRILETTKEKITMEFIQGTRLKELFNSSDKETRKKLAIEIGKSIGKLHKHEIVHGDLTTSNMIFKDKVYFIDFGLGDFSKRTEDHATDLAVLHEAVKSTHFRHLDEIWNNIVEGYKQTNDNWEQALKTVEKIRLRGRYIDRKKKL